MLDVEAIKMIMLGTINGKITDLERMIEVNNTYIICVHQGEYIKFFEKNKTMQPSLKEFPYDAVELNRVYKEKAVLGCIGKCNCGKIYYKIGK